MYIDYALILLFSLIFLFIIIIYRCGSISRAVLLIRFLKIVM